MLESFERLNYLLDPVLLWLFKLPLPPEVAYFTGLVMLCLILVMIGELSMAGVYFINRKHFAGINREMVKNHNLSVKAIAQKDKSSYKACNSLANEAFGRNFFSHIALFASSVWPVPLALSWLAFRFSDIVFELPFSIPGSGSEVGNNFVFIPMYIVIRILFSRVKGFIPPFRQIRRAVSANESAGEDLMSWGDLIDPGKTRNGETS